MKLNGPNGAAGDPLTGVVSPHETKAQPTKYGGRRLRLTERTFFVFYARAGWYFRIRGLGLGLRDHRVEPPLHSERHKLTPDRHWHLGPYCLTLFVPASMPRRKAS